MPAVTHSIIVEASLTETFEISNQIESWPKMMKEYKSVDILGHEGQKVWFRIKNETGAEWVSWRLIYPQANFAFAERYEPKSPFKYMHILWTYRELWEQKTEMTWEMMFELPDETRDQEEIWTRRLTEHTHANQASMKAYIESQVFSKSGELEAHIIKPKSTETI